MFLLTRCDEKFGIWGHQPVGDMAEVPYSCWQNCGYFHHLSLKRRICWHLIQVEGALENLKKSLIIHRPWNILNKSLIIQRPWNILNKSLIIQRSWNILNKSLIIQRPWNILNKSLIIQRLFWFDCVITVFAWMMRKASRVWLICVPAYFCHKNYIPAGGV